ncbi:hypothetical protein FKV24_004650 [Lysobacter maris]|uniref:Uncharacterized protein n=1 Tax=Marilutibacter maris TaxID=1605891 RepID=A0A508AWS2_9GAMM|nr:hypothetical protein [Lysobacter maris]KAB8196186.1 hypothetical protein FKV24_004650 [Lysobacter maris]
MRARAGWLICILCAGFSGAAMADEVKQEAIDEMTDAAVQLFPMGRVFEMFATEDPLWPLQEKPDAITAEQLSCVREELSQPGYWRAKREEVVEYAEAHPDRFDDDLRLLRSGSAELLGKLVMGGVMSAQSGEPVDESELLAGVSNDQVLSMMTLVGDPDYADLRRMTGLGESMSPDQSKAQIEKSGYQKGFSLAARQMIKAMRSCDVPPSAYL